LRKKIRLSSDHDDHHQTTILYTFIDPEKGKKERKRERKTTVDRRRRLMLTKKEQDVSIIIFTFTYTMSVETSNILWSCCRISIPTKLWRQTDGQTVVPEYLSYFLDITTDSHRTSSFCFYPLLPN
jgi:hypothetical protein